MRVAWERLRARKMFGVPIAASSAMIATTIMISMRVRPARLLFRACNMVKGFLSGSFVLQEKVAQR